MRHSTPPVAAGLILVGVALGHLVLPKVVTLTKTVEISVPKPVPGPTRYVTVYKVKHGKTVHYCPANELNAAFLAGRE